MIQVDSEAVCRTVEQFDGAVGEGREGQRELVEEVTVVRKNGGFWNWLRAAF